MDASVSVAAHPGALHPCLNCDTRAEANTLAHSPAPTSARLGPEAVDSRTGAPPQPDPPQILDPLQAPREPESLAAAPEGTGEGALGRRATRLSRTPSAGLGSTRCSSSLSASRYLQGVRPTVVTSTMSAACRATSADIVSVRCSSSLCARLLFRLY